MLSKLSDLIGLKVKHRHRADCNYYTGEICKVYNNGPNCLPTFDVLNLNNQVVKYTHPNDWQVVDSKTPINEVFDLYNFKG